jgi:CMP-N-acetylneuraminic acid synthetase
MNMRTFAFIFARGGSKGLPGKNIKPLGGIPLLAHSIRLGQELPVIDRVFVSTDDAEIADIARQFRADVIDRPASMATDDASEWLAWKHAIAHVRDDLQQSFDVFLSLPATSPLRGHSDVENCLQALDLAADVVITVTPSARSPYFNMVTKDESGFARVVLGSAQFNRRQDVPPVYDITTVAYVTRPDFVMSSNRLFDGRVRAVVIPKERAVDIDDEFDFKVAQALFQL